MMMGELAPLSTVEIAVLNSGSWKSAFRSLAGFVDYDCDACLKRGDFFKCAPFDAVALRHD